MFWFTMLNLAADLVLLRLFQESIDRPEDLDPEKGENLNMSAALAHLLADLLRAVAVLVSGLLIWIWRWNSALTDAWCSFFVSLFIIVGTLQIGKRLCWESKDARRYAAFDDELDEQELPDVSFDAVMVSVDGGLDGAVGRSSVDGVVAGGFDDGGERNQVVKHIGDESGRAGTAVVDGAPGGRRGARSGGRKGELRRSSDSRSTSRRTERLLVGAPLGRIRDEQPAREIGGGATGTNGRDSSRTSGQDIAIVPKEDSEELVVLPHR